MNSASHKKLLNHKLTISKQNTEKRQKDAVEDSYSFNFGYYLLMHLYRGLKLLRCAPSWKTTRHFVTCCEEVSLQLDVTYLMRQLLFLDACMTKLF